MQPKIVIFWYSAEPGLTGNRSQYSWENPRQMMNTSPNVNCICIVLPAVFYSKVISN